MYTQCPKCLTYFQVTAEHLKVAQGNVRCGQCSNVFSALGNLSESPPQQNTTQKNTADSTSRASRSPAGGQQNRQAASNNSAAADGNPQSKLTNAIAAIQALNQSSQKILSQGRKNYVNQLQKQAQVKRKTTSSDSNSSTARELTQEELETPPNETVSDDFNIEEALAAVDGIEVDTDDLPIQYGDGDDITPSYDASELVEDYKGEKTSDAEQKSPGKKRSKYLKSDDVHIDDDDDIFSFTEMDLPDEQEAERKKASTTKKKKSKKTKSKKKAVKKKAAKKKAAKSKSEEKPAVDTSPQDDAAYVEEIEISSDAAANEQNIEIPQNIISDPDVIIENNIPTLAIPKALLEDFEQEKVSHVNYRSMLTWGGLSVLMMLVFLGQTIYFKHNELGQISSLRPWVKMFCKHASCELTLQEDINQIELLGQDIRTHPKSKQALLVSATIINNASFTQPYPGLQLSFSDINGIKVASRNFKPEDYLPSKFSRKKGMESNIPIQLELELVDPGKNAVNFEFDFFSM